MKNTKLLKWKYKEDLCLLKVSLCKNEVAIVSTDTVLGLSGALTQPAFNALTKLKGDRSNKPYLILIGSLEKLPFFLEKPIKNKQLLKLLAYCWPGPLTVVFKAKSTLPAWIASSEGTVALRCPNHDGLLTLLADFEGIYSTSANKSGKPIPESFQYVNQDILNEVSYVMLDDEQRTEKTPSTIIDCSELADHTDGKIRVIREGKYPITELEKLYGESFE